LDDTVAQGNIK